MSHKIAFVLSGGAAKGAFQVGVLKTLEKRGVKPDVIYGTSVGAINAAGYAYAGIEELEKVWLSIKKPKDVGSFNWSSLWGSSDGLYNMKPLEKKLNTLSKGKEPQCEVVVTKVDLENGILKYARSGQEDFLRSVLGSAAFPGVFSPIDGCIDGGVREKAPLNKAIKEGAKEIHLILTTPIINYEQCWKSPGDFGELFQVVFRAFELLNHEVYVNDIKKCQLYNKKANKQTIKLMVYAPTELLIGDFEFGKEKIQKVISQGANTVDQTTWLD